MDFFRIVLREGADFDGFRAATRRLVARQVPPSAVLWSGGEDVDFFGTDLPEEAPPLALPRAIGCLIETVICHRDPERYAFLYTLIWRVLHGERRLPEIASDPLVHRLEMLRKAIHRDLHKMHAFLRFRETDDPDGTERYVAWFEPDHYILEAAAPFFVERFRGLIWSILTPQGSLHWNREALTLGPPAKRSDAPDSDAFEAAWRGYYESTFNPARVNPKAMRTEMAKKYWHNMPETRAIPELVRAAPARMREMIEKEAAMSVKRDPVKAVAAMAEQEPHSLKALNRIIAAAEPLVPGADHAVLGEGSEGAAIAFVGEQPGDQEDREGRPFVGPAGQLLNQAMEEAGIDRRGVYITNAVKHFKFEQRGKKRIHQKPTTGEIKRYRWWLMKELDFVKPKLVVALGATAALALAGKAVSVTKARGETQFGEFAGYITVHPSYLLRIPDAAAKEAAYEAFRDDLKKVKKLAA
ncbi:MAG TPA: UdgX family uracil-DNA binding protein [Dongiaceae bacterium]